MAFNPSSPSRPHALVIPYPAQGHTNPMMQLSKKLASKGFTVTVVNAKFFYERVVQSNSQSGRTISEDTALDIRLESIPLPVLDVEDLTKIDPVTVMEEIEKMSGPVGQLLERLSMEQPRVTCIISDAAMSTWTQELADMYHLPRIAFMTCSQAVNIFFFNVLQLLSPAQMPLLAKANKRDIHAANGSIKDAAGIITGLPGLPPLRPADLPSFLDHGGDEYMYNHIHRQFHHCRKAERVFVNTFYELESLAIDAMSLEVPTYGVGPLLPSGYSGGNDKSSGTSFWPEQDECLQWLDEQPAGSVLYVSFGSSTVLSVPQFQEIAIGLEAASEQRFLWVLRPGLIADVSTDPLTLLPEGFLERTSERGFVVSWAPQLLVLSHASVGCFLTHCGWNSTLESISNGIPMIAWPYFGDQMMNCRFIVHEWKIGMEFEAREDGLVAREEVGRVVREMMEGEEGKERRGRALKMRDVARKSIMEGGDSYKNIHAFVEKMWLEVQGPG